MDGYRKQIFYFRNLYFIVTIKKIIWGVFKKVSSVCSNFGGLSKEMVWSPSYGRNKFEFDATSECEIGERDKKTWKGGWCN